jgi:hypothetical protein
MLNLPMKPFSSHCGRYEKFTNRRDFLKKAGAGFGLLGLAGLLQDEGLLAADLEPSRGLDPMAALPSHYPAKARSIIWLFMEGAPSSVDLFDPKPELTKRDGQRIAIDVFNGNPGPLMKSPFAFKQYGESGAWVCEKYPNVARHVDDFAFIKSLYSESNDHVPALYQINTGIPRPGFRSDLLLPFRARHELVLENVLGHAGGHRKGKSHKLTVAFHKRRKSQQRKVQPVQMIGKVKHLGKSGTCGKLFVPIPIG